MAYVIKRLWRWLETGDQAYSFLMCLCCVIYLYTMASPVFKNWRNECMILAVMGFAIIGARVAMQSVKKTMIWLLVTPFVFSLLLVAFLANSLNDLSANFNIALVVIATATVIWAGTACFFDADKTKMAMSILNDIFRYILALSLVANWYQYPGVLIAFTKPLGMAPGTVIEASIKIITLPYVLAGIAGVFVLNLKQWKII